MPTDLPPTPRTHDRRARPRILRRGPQSVQVGHGLSDGILVDGFLGSELSVLPGWPLPLPETPTGPLCRGRLADLARFADDSGLGRPSQTASRVLVDGAGEACALLVDVLRDRGHDVRAGRHEVDLADLAVRQGDRRDMPDVVVLVSAAGAATARSLVWREGGVAHLPLVHDGGRVVAGPLVVPGGPCVRCLHLHRRDRDPAWPMVAAQAAADPLGARIPAGSAALGAGLADLLIDNFVRRGQVAVGVSFEVRPPEPQVIARRWERHPDCDGHRSSGTMSE